MRKLADNKIVIENMQKELLKMLQWLIDICEENDITYYLAGGTLLGAVRHQGFIPWDDDIDIMLPRNQYEKLLDICLKKMPENYVLKTLKTDEDYDYPYAKLENKVVIVKESINKETSHLWIDIFPLDGTPDNEMIRRIHLTVLFGMKYARWEANTLNHYYRSKWKLGLKVLFFWPCILYGSRKISIAIDKIAKKYSFDESNVIACVVGKYNAKECLVKERMSYGIWARFQNLDVKIPNGYDEYLTALYGNYMKLPKEEDRKKHIV